MDEIFSLFPIIGAIAVIVFAVCEILKVTPLPTKYLPAIALIIGAALGLVGKYLNIADLSTLSILDAIATGIVSALTATGTFSLIKNLGGAYPSNSTPKTKGPTLE